LPAEEEARSAEAAETQSAFESRHHYRQLNRDGDGNQRHGYRFDNDSYRFSDLVLRMAQVVEEEYLRLADELLTKYTRHHKASIRIINSTWKQGAGFYPAPGFRSSPADTGKFDDISE
jgi:hypothetical protein